MFVHIITTFALVGVHTLIIFYTLGKTGKATHAGEPALPGARNVYWMALGVKAYWVDVFSISVHVERAHVCVT